MSTDKKIYFLSDFHLGVPNYEASLAREKRIVAFLLSIKDSASEIFIVGDMFDFWFEYKTVVPKGYVRLLGTLATLSDLGIKLHFFVGNHDMWMRNYFQQELNMPVYYEPKEFELQGKKLLVGHGDGLGPGDKGYKLMKKVFRNPVCKFLFGILPPNMALGIANYFSKKSRIATGGDDAIFLGAENEWLFQYSNRKLETKFYDYFVFGHRHLPLHLPLQKGSSYINLGEWINYNSYAVMHNGMLELCYYKSTEA